MKRFGVIVKEAMKAKGVNGTWLAKRLGTSRSYVSGWCTLKLRPPKASTIVFVSRELGLDPETMVCIAYLEKRPKMLRLKTISRMARRNGKAK